MAVGLRAFDDRGLTVHPSKAPESRRHSKNISVRRKITTKAVAAASWVSLALVLGAWALLYAGDSWGPATAAMFGPRWLLLLPPALLTVPALVVRRRSLGPLLLAIVLTLGPVMGFSVPWDRLGRAQDGVVRLRVLTCNMHYGKLDPAPLGQLVTDIRPDVVALQEWKASATTDPFDPGEWHVCRGAGQFLASRFPVRTVEQIGADSVGEDGSVIRYELDTPFGTTTLFSLHFATPREGLHQVLDDTWNGLAGIEAGTALRRVQSERLARKAAAVAGPVILVGDFNTPPESAIFRRVWEPYTDAFSSAGWGWGYTFRTRLIAVRIDHILIGRGLRCDRCWVAPAVGSPHRPVVADIALGGE
jgi:endonuclease/exonuclease/phosphatase (EEP) superfamily protein YafD